MSCDLTPHIHQIKKEPFLQHSPAMLFIYVEKNIEPRMKIKLHSNGQ